MRIKYPTDLVNNSLWESTSRTTYSYWTYDDKRVEITAKVTSPESINYFDKRVYFTIANIIDKSEAKDDCLAVSLISGYASEMIADEIESTVEQVDDSLLRMRKARVMIDSTDEASKTRYAPFNYNVPLLSLMTFNGIRNLPLYVFAAYRNQLCIFDAKYLRMTADLDHKQVDMFTIRLLRTLNNYTRAAKKKEDNVIEGSISCNDYRTASLIMDAAQYCGLVDQYNFCADDVSQPCTHNRIEYIAPAVSQLQSQVRNVLDELQVPYSEEYEFPDLLSPKGNPLRFDFLTVDNDGQPVLIEVQGEGHDHDVEINRLQREVTDKMKKDYCAAKGIRLVEIWYYDDIRAAVYQAVKRERSED